MYKRINYWYNKYINRDKAQSLTEIEMNQFDDLIKTHLLQHSNLMQVVSTINDCPGISSCLSRVIGGVDQKDDRLGEKLIQDFRNDFWGTQLRLIAPEYTPIQEFLHDQSDAFVHLFTQEIGEQHPLYVIESERNLKVVTIDYSNNQPYFYIHIISSKGMRISSLSGLSSVEQLLKCSKPVELA